MELAAGLQAPHIPNNPGAIGERLLKMTANLTTAREAAARLGGIESLPSPAQIRFTRADDPIRGDASERRVQNSTHRGSNPGSPASHSGLSIGIACTDGSADISVG
jgi:hypothetical protein